jgi:putative acetyltransferase
MSTSALRIVRDDPSAPGVRDLLVLHLSGMRAASPPESVHALDLSGLQRPDVAVWSAWDGDTVVGIGALRVIDPALGEVKSMRTHPDHLGRGVGRALLDVILAEARSRGLDRLALETGSTPEFDAAHRLYERAGFVACGPFGDYTEDPFSRFFVLVLDDS